MATLASWEAEVGSDSFEAKAKKAAVTDKSEAMEGSAGLPSYAWVKD